MQSFNLNLVPGSFQQVFNCSQGDVDRQLTIRLFDGSAEYTVPVGATVKIKATKPSGFGFNESATFSGSAVTITTTETMTNEWGRFPAELEITNEGLVIGTANFLFNVEKNPHPASTVDGDAEEVIPELTLLVERVEAAASSVLDMEVVAETLPAGSQATYSYDEDLNKATFGIPQGEAGAGAAGVVASAYSSSKTYKVGDYAIHNSNLYRCITAITTAEAFTAAHWTQIVLADDVSDLKTDLQDEISGTTGNIPIELVHGKWINLAGDVGSYVPMENGVPQYRSNYVEGWYCGMMQCSAGDNFIINGTSATAIRLYGFIDSTGKVLKVASALATATDLLVTAPSTSAWIIVHTGDGDVRHSYKNKGVKKSLEELTARVDKLSEADVIILGDSWSDTDPDHTSYTKWPVYFEKWNKCNLHNYAQNGSQIYGTDNYGVDGTVGGQMATAIADTTYDHNNVKLIIIEGGLNDYSHHTTVENLVSGFVSLINRGHTNFPNARIVCVLNNMILTCQNIWYYMQTAKAQIKAQTGCPAFTTFGWVPSANYVADQMHIDDEGYRYFASNMIAICCGGSPTFISNKATKEEVETTGGAEIALTVKESFTEDSLTRIISCTVSHPTSNGFANIHFDYNDGVLCSMPFYSFPDLQVTGGTVADMATICVRGYSDVDDYSDFAVQVAHKTNSGTFIGQQILTPNAL